MAQFKLQLSIKGTESQLMGIIPKLTNLGYTRSCWSNTYSNTHQILLTNFGGEHHRIDFNQVPHTNKLKKHHIIENFNEDLILALAAMRDSDELYKGEYVVCKDTHIGHLYTYGNLYRAENNYWGTPFLFRDNNGDINGYGESNKAHFRKATASEITHWFTNKKENSNMEKEIVGYKVKDGIDIEAAQKIVGTYGILMPQGCHFQAGSIAHNKAVELNVLESLFMPVFKEPKYKNGQWVIYKNVPGDGIPADAPITVQYNNQETGYFSGLIKPDFYGLYKGSWFGLSHKGIIREATEEEIAKAIVKIVRLKSGQGFFEIEVSSKGLFYKGDGKFLDIEPIRKIIRDAKNASILCGSYEFKITHIDSGCKKQVPIEDWEKVLKAYDEFQKGN